MLKITETEVFGWRAAIRGMRNAHESWDKSDSFIPCWVKTKCHECEASQKCAYYFEDGEPYKKDEFVGPNDLKLMKQLVAAGTDHSKFMRMIHAQCDWEAPLYWWKEADTYKVGTVRNSCSTMHKITEHEFTMDMFSVEHLCTARDDMYKEFCDYMESLGNPKGEFGISPYRLMQDDIIELNAWRDFYLHYKSKPHKDQKAHEENLKKIWWQIIQRLGSNYNQKATMDLNYQVLRNMYHPRKHHKQDEWRIDFCNWVKELPYSELITMTKEELLESIKEG